jgi:threonine dehydratase
MRMSGYHSAMSSAPRARELPSDAPTIDDVAEAMSRLAPLAWRSPFVRSNWLSDLVNADVRLKLEMVQETGSFKIRGAANAVAQLRVRHPDVTRIVTASAGNHGQAIALAARRAGLHAQVYVPASAPAAKRDSLRRLGAQVIETDSYEAAEAGAHDAVRRGDGVYISPYNDPDVIAGAGTAAMEMFDAVPNLDALIVPVGGGGLIAGSAIVANAQRRAVRVVGVEALASPVFTSSLSAGKIVTVDVHPSLADGLTGNLEPGSGTFAIARALVDRVVAVDEAAIARAMHGLVHHERLVVEGAGAVGVAALIATSLAAEFASQTIGVILSGRNVDSSALTRVLSAAPIR